MARQYFVYIMTNRSKTLYVSVNDLHRRVYEHRNSVVNGFTSKYKIRFQILRFPQDDSEEFTSNQS
jgi:putative endonuclease